MTGPAPDGAAPDESVPNEARLPDQAAPDEARLPDEATLPDEAVPDGPTVPDGALIDVRDLTVRYGAAVAVEGVHLRVDRGELVALIGPNGAGKTSLVNAVCGLIRPAAGTVRRHGRVALVPEGRQLFAPLTVDDNLRLGGWRGRDRNTSAIYELMPELVPLRHRRAGLLSGGEQQMVAVGRALMARPDVLVIDEMSLGLAPLVVDKLADHLRDRNRAEGLAVLLIEQNARLALELCGRGYVLEAGRLVAEGSSAELAANPAVTDAYLGAA
jgi:branched-chain amino acid transport system ATP-binding protein